jgi:hypothetical protein
MDLDPVGTAPARASKQFLLNFQRILGIDSGSRDGADDPRKELDKDSVSGLRWEGLATNTPLTSMSSSTFFVDSSVSVPQTTLTSVYLESPVNPSNRPTSQSGRAAHSFPRLNLPPPAPWPPYGSSQIMANFAPGLTQGIPMGPGPVSLPETLNEARPPDSSRQRILSSGHSSQLAPPEHQRSVQAPYPGHLELLHAPNLAESGDTRPNDMSEPTWNSPRFQSPLLQPWNQLYPPYTSLYGHVPGSYQSPRPPVLLQDVFGAPPFGVQESSLGTSIARDALLAYAHRLYNDSTDAPLGLTPVPQQTETASSGLHHGQLIHLLESIRSQHPQHLPTLLLLSCVQYSIGDYDACLSTCYLILSIDPDYVRWSHISGRSS